MTNYYSVGGQIFGEQSSGSAQRDYLRDSLGSVVGTAMATTVAASSVENSYRYKPYGTLLAKTGTSPDPDFQ